MGQPRQVDASWPELIDQKLERHVYFHADQENCPSHMREDASMLEVPNADTCPRMDTFGGDTLITAATLEKYSENS